jgi:hypothetical protein
MVLYDHHLSILFRFSKALLLLYAHSFRISVYFARCLGHSFDTHHACIQTFSLFSGGGMGIDVGRCFL